jgi:hypothetical protein|tara:strand:- start:2921 stop:3025 length:105 start_codon:yes stop_codon:yes gene_type:complete
MNNKGRLMSLALLIAAAVGIAIYADIIVHGVNLL